MSVNFQICPNCREEVNIDLGDDGPLMNTEHDCKQKAQTMTDNPTGALRRAYEEAAKEIDTLGSDAGPEWEKTIQDTIERNVSPVVKALVGAAYRLCAEAEFDERALGDPNPQYERVWASAYRAAIFAIRRAIRTLTLEDAARALERRELEIRLEELNGLPDVDMAALDTYVGERAMKFEARLAALSKPAPAEQCGASAAPFIPRWGMSFACVLPKGHVGKHQQGGKCLRHGEYIGKQCPHFPDCLPAPAVESEKR